MRKKKIQKIHLIILAFFFVICPVVLTLRIVYADGLELGSASKADSSFSEISGTLTTDTTLDLASSPWYVTDDLSVPNNVTLTIDPGVTVYVADDKRITINGRFVADGTADELIHLTRLPDSGKWDGLQLVETMEDNRITYALVEHARTNDGMIGLKDSNLLIENVTLANTDLKRIRMDNSSLIVRNCVFTDMFAPNQPPTTDNRSEHIWGSGVPETGHFIIEGNIFGTTPGHNDAIDFDSPRRQNTIMLIANNVFMGGGDDALDVEADLHIVGNIFMNYRRDKYNKAVGESNAISAGGSGPNEERDYIVTNNIFRNLHHVAQVKDEAFMTFVNNTVVGVSAPAIFFRWPKRRPGRGAYVDSSIFWQSAVVFGGVEETTELTVHHSVIPSEWHLYGRGNIDADPCFADPGYWDPNGTPEDANDDFWVDGDYHLKSQAGRYDPNTQSWVKDDVTSPCIDAGELMTPIGPEPFPNGGIINMGAYGGTIEASKSYFDKPPCEIIVAGDINGDCEINFKDFFFIALHWLHNP